MKSVKLILGVVLVVSVGDGWLAGRPVRAWADDAGSQETFSDLDQMLFDARQAFKERRFDVAITTCEKILRKNPDQLTALKIMGSGYYMLNEYARARHVWQRALEVAPDDPDIPRYMERLPESSP
jgi:tetratricopeptide (TPR) repeat protein